VFFDFLIAYILAVLPETKKYVNIYPPKLAGSERRRVVKVHGFYPLNPEPGEGTGGRVHVRPPEDISN